MAPRIVPCEACGTEGRLYVTCYAYDRQTGPYWDERDTGPCPYCNGTGGEIVETEPIDMDDLDAMAGMPCDEPGRHLRARPPRGGE